MKYKNVYACECENHEYFTANEKSKPQSTFYTNCTYCGKISNLKFVKTDKC